MENNKWKKRRLKYVIYNGLLLRGVCFSIVYSILTMVFNPRGEVYTSEQIVTRFVVYTIMFSSLGILISNFQWNISKKKYLEEVNKCEKKPRI